MQPKWPLKVQQTKSVCTVKRQSSWWWWWLCFYSFFFAVHSHSDWPQSKLVRTCVHGSMHRGFCYNLFSSHANSAIFLPFCRLSHQSNFCCCCCCSALPNCTKLPGRSILKFKWRSPRKCHFSVFSVWECECASHGQQPTPPNVWTHTHTFAIRRVGKCGFSGSRQTHNHIEQKSEQGSGNRAIRFDYCRTLLMWCDVMLLLLLTFHCNTDSSLFNCHPFHSLHFRSTSLSILGAGIHYVAGWLASPSFLYLAPSTAGA